MLQNPTLWLTLAAFVLSAVLMVVCSLDQRLWLQCIGAVSSVLLMIAALVMGELISSGGASFVPVSVNLISAVLSGLLAILYLIFTQNSNNVERTEE